MFCRTKDIAAGADCRDTDLAGLHVAALLSLGAGLYDFVVAALSCLHCCLQVQGYLQPPPVVGRPQWHLSWASGLHCALHDDAAAAAAPRSAHHYCMGPAARGEAADHFGFLLLVVSSFVFPKFENLQVQVGCTLCCNNSKD